jgi:DMSO/TMAO reductase YedYZ molybdopterin-dependent catalytic subunit
MRSETRVATLECAGNGRVFLVPQVRGAQWELGAVSNAEWTGVPLRAADGPALYRQHPQGRQAGRPAGPAVDQVRVRHQPADGEDARHRGGV